ncbi:hypothetical protein A3D78_04000 [Candidatus Gottesmanbacteria bacterium RIFCSPHIGHO2_02_FULL_39_14]|uniref:Excinuclease ABC subunit C n=2 Tax=Candidatus Gottesmaniibacteriota TaxID=1752720 RepID=A0A1F6A0Z3_9BACT|nr:MAG: hypothetical protein A2153_01260 [Candidatus Gottesmanbacteria bacterium RBG_16_38_7b]OGG18369.1 MAG: hypothetical protein A3D78_04000 [Candidatus Gottesmanbacteria bacterium RIFCSPHIGHO2_02_FULL_39_14]
MNYSPHKLSALPQTSGVYLFKDMDKSIIYIGKAVNLKKRISSYFRRNIINGKLEIIASTTRYINTIEVRSEFEALLLEARLIKKHKPKYNIILRNGKSYIYILITNEAFPRLLISRKTGQKGSIFGPFPSSRIVREIIGDLRRIFPFCTQKLPAKRVCFYHHLGLCRPCPAEIIKAEEPKHSKLKKEYLRNIISIKKILSGYTDKVIKNLQSDMNNTSRSHEFEKAAQTRDRIGKLNILQTGNYRFIDEYLENPDFAVNSWKAEQINLTELLKKYLNISSEIKSIECYDISNIQGKFATGSMITFYQGKPDKSRYRHFRIKKLVTPNDLEMLKEVFYRRLKHLEWPLADLIMVDGGQQQLTILLQALAHHHLDKPAIALAKRFEEIYIYVNRHFLSVRLKKDSPALNLIKRIRDEAHRFALNYHQKLRIKYLLELLHN